MANPLGSRPRAANQTMWQTSTLKHAEHSVSNALKSCMSDLIYILSTEASTAMKNAVTATRAGYGITHTAKQLTACLLTSVASQRVPNPCS